MAKIEAALAGIEDCETAVNEGADPAALTRLELGADESLISAMGRTWVLDSAGAPDHSDESWQSHGIPWCSEYRGAFENRARELAGKATA